MRIRLSFRAAVCALLIGACARMPDTGVTPLKARGFADLQQRLLAAPADLEQFRLRGPFEVTTELDREIELPPARAVVGDLYLAAMPGKGPLVILLHGYGNSKHDHSYQGLHLASWGLHCLVITLPNTGPWNTNGRTVAQLVRRLRENPGALDARVDATTIVLAGHSFGATSMAIALADGAPAAGGVLLDPAGIGRDLPDYLRRIERPVMLLRADAARSVARNRDLFYRDIRQRVAEVSVRNAVHEDAQYPAIDARTSEDAQLTFAGALAAGAFSLAATGDIDYAWASFEPSIRKDQLFGPKRK